MRIEHFVYSREQVETIYQFLDHNQWDVNKVFDCVWREGVFPKAKRHDAGKVLDLVDKVAMLKKLVGRSSERIWNQMTQEATDGPCSP